MSDFEKATPVTEDEMDDIRVELELDDKTVQCKILTIFETEGQDYIALLPLDENGEEPDEGEVYIYRYFEDEEGDPIDPGMDIPPYDLNAEIIQIEDVDYGLWYLDAFENQDRYDGRKVRFRAKVMKSKRFPEGMFVPGRNAMTCCEDDIRFVGCLCRSEFTDLLKSRQWIWLTAQVSYVYQEEYGEEGPVLTGLSFERAEAPEEDLVYFT